MSHCWWVAYILSYHQRASFVQSSRSFRSYYGHMKPDHGKTSWPWMSQASSTLRTLNIYGSVLMESSGSGAYHNSVQSNELHYPVGCDLIRSGYRPGWWVQIQLGLLSEQRARPLSEWSHGCGDENGHFRKWNVLADNTRPHKGLVSQQFLLLSILSCERFAQERIIRD
jgi:hypothetical protein